MEPARLPDRSGREGDDAIGMYSKTAPPSDADTGTPEDHRDTRQQYQDITSQGNSRVHMGNVYGGQHFYEPPPPHSEPEDLSLRDALAFEQMDFRSSTIAPAYSKTCDWLFSSSEYKRWRDKDLVPEHNGFLWIKGKPGAGKSTVTKHASEHSHTIYKSEITASFFFNARGTSLGKSTEGMYRCLLYQMVDLVPQLSSKVKVPDRRVYHSKGWPLALLENLFRQAVLRISGKQPLNCYVDALDEGEDDDKVRGTVDLFCELAEQAASEKLPFRVCLASRYYPKISVHYLEEIRLEDQKGHRRDIASYVQGKLKLGGGQIKEELASEIIRRSSGVFLWVVLVIVILNKEGDRGNQHLLRNHLRRIPDDLHDLLEALQKRDPFDERFLPAISWVLFAFTPLTIEQLYFAILTSVGQLTAQNVLWDRNTIDASVINDYILSSSKGLLEIGPEEYVQNNYSRELATSEAGISSTRDPRLGAKVQFIHEAVREYFLGDGLFRLDPDLAENAVAVCHNRLSQICQTYVRTSCKSRTGWRLQYLSRYIEDCSPFLSYCLSRALEHANLASQKGRPIIDLAQNFPRDEWISCTASLSYRHAQTWLQLVTRESFAQLVVDELASMAECSRRGGQSFQSALNTCSSGVGSALHIAVDLAPSCLQILLDAGADVHVMCKEVGTPLHTAVLAFRKETASLLLKHGANPNAMDDHGNTALHSAIVRRDLRVMNVLLNGGADMNRPIGEYGDGVQTASQTNDWRVMQMLADFGAGVDASDFSSSGPYKHPFAARRKKFDEGEFSFPLRMKKRHEIPVDCPNLRLHSEV